MSFIFFVLITASALMLALCMSISQKSGDVLKVYANILGNQLTDFLGSVLCFWIAISAVILWFVLWIITTKRAGSAIRGLGIGCAVSPLAVLLAELSTMLVVCTFKYNSNLSPFADSLPSQFINTSGKNVIFLISSAIIASLGILICKINKLSKNKKASSENDTPMQAETSQSPINDPVIEPAPMPVPAYENIFAEIPSVNTSDNISNIDIPISENSPEISEIISSDTLQGVCHMCGEKNDPNVKFCGKCGAKLI